VKEEDSEKVRTPYGAQLTFLSVVLTYRSAVTKIHTEKKSLSKIRGTRGKQNKVWWGVPLISRLLKLQREEIKEGAELPPHLMYRFWEHFTRSYFKKGKNTHMYREICWEVSSVGEEEEVSKGSHGREEKPQKQNYIHMGSKRAARHEPTTIAKNRINADDAAAHWRFQQKWTLHFVLHVTFTLWSSAYAHCLVLILPSFASKERELHYSRKLAKRKVQQSPSHLSVHLCEGGNICRSLNAAVRLGHLPFIQHIKEEERSGEAEKTHTIMSLGRVTCFSAEHPSTAVIFGAPALTQRLMQITRKWKKNKTKTQKKELHAADVGTGWGAAGETA
jgi:hypothetical protein